MANNSLRSFASGMIIATSIFTAVYFLQPSNEDSSKAEEALTEENVQQYLNEHGYISIPKQTYDELTAKASENGVESNEKNEDRVVQESDNRVEKQAAEAKHEKVEKSEQEKTYIITVNNGMSSNSVATMLEQYGIIESSHEFEEFLQENDWSRSIQIGTYELDSTMSYDEIGRIITKK